MTKHTLLGLTSVLALLASPLHAADVPDGVTLADTQTFSYRLGDNFASLDPQLIEGTIGADVARQLFEGLLIQDAEGNLIPGVAAEWEANEDNTEFTFTLRENARWSNGDPVTAGDFVYSWRRAADPATASEYAWFVELSGIQNAAQIIAGEAEPDTLGVEAVDDKTLRVTLEAPKPYFPQMTVHTTLMPVHQPTVEEFGDNWTDPGNMVSNGAYVLDSVSLNEQWSGSKNPEYWDAENVVIDEITGFIVVELNQALTRWEADEYAMLDEVPAGSFPRLEEEYPDAAFVVPRLCSYYYEVNQREDAPEALKDVNVRRALALAIDRELLVERVLQGGQYPAYSFTPEATADFEAPEIEMASMTQAERDAEAQRLIEEAEYDDLSFTLLYNTNEAHRQLATVISQMWSQKLGVDVTLENQEWSTYLDNKRNGAFEITRSGWCGDYNEASTFLDVLTSDIPQNSGDWSNAEYDALLAEAATAEDPADLYRQAEQILIGDMGIIPIYHYTRNIMLDPAVEGFPFDNVESNWYVKDMYRIASE